MQEPFDRRAWAYAMLYVNLYGPQLLYSARNSDRFFFYAYCIFGKTMNQKHYFIAIKTLMDGSGLYHPYTHNSGFALASFKHNLWSYTVSTCRYCSMNVTTTPRFNNYYANYISSQKAGKSLDYNSHYISNSHQQTWADQHIYVCM